MGRIRRPLLEWARGRQRHSVRILHTYVHASNHVTRPMLSWLLSRAFSSSHPRVALTRRLLNRDDTCVLPTASWHSSMNLSPDDFRMLCQYEGTETWLSGHVGSRGRLPLCSTSKIGCGRRPTVLLPPVRIYIRITIACL